MGDFNISSSVLVNIDFTIWTGRAKLDAIDIPEAIKAMPPKDLCTAGSIKIFNSDLLKPFRNFKTKADLLAGAVGCRMLNAWLVDDANIGTLEGQLADVYTEWSRVLSDFVRDYPAEADVWACSCGAWDWLIRRKQPSAREIGRRFHFGWQTFKLTPESSRAASLGNETDSLVGSIPDSALQSVIDSLKELYDESFNKASDPSAKAYGALRRIAERARALGFANPQAARLAPVLLDLVGQKNHTLTRLVLSNMNAPQGVADILAVNDGQGLDSLLTQTAPTPPDIHDALAACRKCGVALDNVDGLLTQAAPVPPDPQELVDGLLTQASQMLNAAPPLTPVNGEGDTIQTDTNGEAAQVGTDADLAATSESPTPCPVQKPLDSMDVLDSLGLF